jgi:hypothetical protein
MTLKLHFVSGENQSYHEVASSEPFAIIIGFGLYRLRTVAAARAGGA